MFDAVTHVWTSDDIVHPQAGESCAWTTISKEGT